MTASRDGQPDVVVTADDTTRSVAGLLVLDVEPAAQYRCRRVTERLRGRDPRHPFGSPVPEHDVAVSVNGHDPVGDVREDGVAALVRERDALVQLGVRDRRRRVARERLRARGLLGRCGAAGGRRRRARRSAPSRPARGTPRKAVAPVKQGVVGGGALARRIGDGDGQLGLDDLARQASAGG